MPRGYLTAAVAYSDRNTILISRCLVSHISKTFVRFDLPLPCLIIDGFVPALFENGLERPLVAAPMTRFERCTFDMHMRFERCDHDYVLPLVSTAVSTDSDQD